jgi:hypothetical protein
MTIRIAKNAKESEIDKTIKRLASVSSVKKSLKADNTMVNWLGALTVWNICAY